MGKKPKRVQITHMSHPMEVVALLKERAFSIADLDDVVDRIGHLRLEIIAAHKKKIIVILNNSKRRRGWMGQQIIGDQRGLFAEEIADRLGLGPRESGDVQATLRDPAFKKVAYVEGAFGHRYHEEGESPPRSYLWGLATWPTPAELAED